MNVIPASLSAPCFLPRVPAVLLACLVSACAVQEPRGPAGTHLRDERAAAVEGEIPEPVAHTVSLAKPRPAARAESYSVSVRNIPVQELLFALARDAQLNIDIHPGINGVVTLNAIDQSLQQILTRIGRQVDMRWELDGQNLMVMPDSPFLRTYRIDYVNMSRDVSGSVSINTQIASANASAVNNATTASGNSSSTTIKSTAQNNFWASLERSLKEILHETDKILPEGSSETTIERSDQQTASGQLPMANTPRGTVAQSVPGVPAAQGGPGGSGGSGMGGIPAAIAGNLQQSGSTVIKRSTFREAASVIMNPEAGVVVVRATARQHEKIQEYLGVVMASSRRQVMIEATIAEVRLKDDYEQGINWQSLRNRRSLFSTSELSLVQSPGGPLFSATGGGDNSKALLVNFLSSGLHIAGTLKLLETFGNVKVLSSPKLSVLNNQTAVLKVVDNYVYFSIRSEQTATPTGTTPLPPILTATPQSVAVGLVMSVTPQISEGSEIVLNVRPTISRILDFKTDPTLPGNTVPQIQTREMESVLRLSDGEIAVMGGLMSDELSHATDAVPGLSKIPGLGNFFTSRKDSSSKTELVIFLKPTVIREPGLHGSYESLRGQLPGRDFFANNPGPKPLELRIGELPP